MSDLDHAAFHVLCGDRACGIRSDVQLAVRGEEHVGWQGGVGVSEVQVVGAFESSVAFLDGEKALFVANDGGEVMAEGTAVEGEDRGARGVFEGFLLLLWGS